MKQRATLSKEKLDELVKQRTKTAHEHWSVKDGVITCDGKGGVSLQTVKDYGNFELFVDWKIEKNGDSGIYLRGQPQVQIWDSDNYSGARGADKGTGSGGLWNNPAQADKVGKMPLKKADKPVGEWNTFHITMIGDEVTVKLNGELVVDKAKLPNYWDKRQAAAGEGTDRTSVPRRPALVQEHLHQGTALDSGQECDEAPPYVTTHGRRLVFVCLSVRILASKISAHCFTLDGDSIDVHGSVDYALYGLGLTPGKLRGLQRISNPNGTLTMVATDQNSSMIKMMKEGRQGRSRPTTRSPTPR